MLVVSSFLKNNVMNLAIHFVAYGYIKGIGIFYVALEKNEGKTMYVTLDNMALRSDNWIQANPLFEEEFNHNDDLRVFFSKMFMVWDGINACKCGFQL